MRILVLAPQPFFSYRGTPLSVYHRTRVMAELGASIDLLTYGQGHDVVIPGVRLLRGPRLGFLGAVPVGPSWRKLVHDFFLTLRTVILLLRNRYDAIHAHEESVFVASWLAPLFGCRLIYDMHSSLPQQLRNFDAFRWRPLVVLFDRLERSALRRADAVITICPELGRLAESRMDDPNRHLVIENSLLDPVKLAAEPMTRADSALEQTIAPRLDGKALIVYAGTFEVYQGIDLLIEAFARLREREPEPHLLMIGGSPSQIEKARRQAEALGLTAQMTLSGPLDQKSTRRWLERAAVVASPRTRGSNTPLKIYELLALARPLVATRVLSHNQILDDAVAYLAEPEPAALAQALDLALDDSAEGLTSRAAAARNLYRERYDANAYRSKILHLLELIG